MPGILYHKSMGFTNLMHINEMKPDVNKCDEIYRKTAFVNVNSYFYHVGVMSLCTELEVTQIIKMGPQTGLKKEKK